MGYSIKSARIIKRLKGDGWVLKSVDGHHHNFRKNGARFIVTVPHPSRDIPIGTLRSILRCTGSLLAYRAMRGSITVRGLTLTVNE